MNGRRRLLGSFNHGSMANALPQAIGAQLTHRERQVIALSGDGGLAMLMGDLLTLRQHELPVKVVVFRNDALAFVELEMKAIGTTSLRRREGTLYPRAARIGGIRVYHEADVELLRRRDTVPPRVAGGTAGFGPWTR